MKVKLTIYLIWAFYAGLVYTAFYPNHEYLNYLDNARTLYLIINIPLQILFSLLLLSFVVTKKDWKSFVEDKDREKNQKFIQHIEKFDKFNLFLFTDRAMYYVTTLIVFVGLGDILLGSTMLFGCILGYYLLETLKDLAKEVKSAIN